MLLVFDVDGTAVSAESATEVQTTASAIARTLAVTTHAVNADSGENGLGVGLGLESAFFHLFKCLGFPELLNLFLFVW